MPEQIISASGVQHPLIVNPDGSLNVSGTLAISGGIVGSVAVTRLPIGSNFDLETSPIASNKNNPAYLFEYIFSGTSTGVTGSAVGSITQFIGTGSFVSVLTWNGDFITNIGSYS